MDNNERAYFIAENLAAANDRQSKQFKKENDRLYKDIISKANYEEYAELMKHAINESIEAMKKWETTPFSELDGQTPEQYFNEMKTMDDVLFLAAAMIEKSGSMFPPSFMESVKKLDESLKDDLLKKIEMIIPGENGELTPVQKSELMIAEIIAPEKYLEPLSRLLFRLDVNSVNEETVDIIMDGLKTIGEASIPCLIAICEKLGHVGVIYSHSIMTLAEIASEHKTEEIYRYLKECFRKSDMKIVEASALGVYGDGRAVAAVRGYAERNIQYMNESEYSCYRDIILKFGGIVYDLDSRFEAEHSH